MQVIQRLSVKNSQRGTLYTIGYFLYDTEYASNKYYYGDSAASWTGDSGAYVYEANYTRDASSQHWILFMTAISGDYNWPALRISEDVQKSMSEGSIIVYPSWFGVKAATAEDARNKLWNLNRTPCKAGEWIFYNATTSSKGTASYKESPFTLETMESAYGEEGTPSVLRILADINQKPTVYVYKVVYSDTRAFTSLEGWNGVNGSWGSGLAPSDTATGRWKALRANIQQYKSQGGSTKNRVERTAQSAPKLEDVNMVWDSTKNGGVWTW